MTAHVDLDALVRLAEAATQVRTTPICDCTEAESDEWFDRSICPEPCGSMHTYCSTCGWIVGQPCANDLMPQTHMPISPDVVLALVERVRAAEAAVERVRSVMRDESWDGGTGYQDRVTLVVEVSALSDALDGPGAPAGVEVGSESTDDLNGPQNAGNEGDA